METTTQVTAKFEDGAHSPKEFAERFITPFFANGNIPLYAGAGYYAICYGELCAYSADNVLLAILDHAVPDTVEDEPAFLGATFAGSQWEQYP